jgi:hypothetical protein
MLVSYSCGAISTGLPEMDFHLSPERRVLRTMWKELEDAFPRVIKKMKPCHFPLPHASGATFFQFLSTKRKQRLQEIKINKMEAKIQVVSLYYEDQ